MISSLAIVSAGFNYHQIHVTNGTVNFDDYTLNIPNGYVEDRDLESIDQAYDSNGLYYSGTVFNQTNSSNYVSMFVLYFNDDRVLDSFDPEVNYTNTTINGIDGILYEGKNNETIFNYFDEGNMVQIHSNSGPEIFEEIV